MKTSSAPLRSRAGFTLVEVMISLTIVVLVLSLALSTFLFGLKAMYRDMERLQTNASLRSFTAQISKETIDASEFYVFPLYTALDGNVDLTNDVSTLTADSFDTFLAYGDCLVLITRVSVDDTTANIRQIRIYYRQVTNSNNDGPIRYWESTDYGSSGTSTSLTALLNAINLNATPAYSGSRVLAKIARGRRIGSTSNYYPIFSTESATTTPTNENVSINVEFLNGSSINNLLSSSSFNYTISPRR
ncbi:MAG: prepilin-type N-terminal cleavage/methylation domain-containing protein [Opitutaceae bacterium]|nr:prepilin-type N-terminal cleavage/methylation domain-containing protein [Opitutaceae bacterium]